MFLGTAESCTGGLIAALCTEISGSSRWFAGGVVSYADAVKSSALGVGSVLLKEHGAVSGPVVEAMAQGALRLLGADAVLAVSGIAGPGGGSAEKPVGTVWIAAALRGQDSRQGDTHGAGGGMLVRRHCFFGDRSRVRLAAALAALDAVSGLLDDRLSTAKALS